MADGTYPLQTVLDATRRLLTSMVNGFALMGSLYCDAAGVYAVWQHASEAQARDQLPGHEHEDRVATLAARGIADIEALLASSHETPPRVRPPSVDR